MQKEVVLTVQSQREVQPLQSVLIQMEIAADQKDLPHEGVSKSFLVG